MTEHSPAPQKSRGIYGFVSCVLFTLLILFYFMWILIPSEWTQTWAYAPPQKYWAIALPTFFCTALFIFAFCIYPALHSLQEGELNDLSAVTDSYAIKPIEEINFTSKKLKHQTLKRRISASLRANSTFDLIEEKQKPIPAASDLCLDEVSQLLYLKNY